MFNNRNSLLIIIVTFFLFTFANSASDPVVHKIQREDVDISVFVNTDDKLYSEREIVMLDISIINKSKTKTYKFANLLAESNLDYLYYSMKFSRHQFRHCPDIMNYDAIVGHVFEYTIVVPPSTAFHIQVCLDQLIKYEAQIDRINNFPYSAKFSFVDSGIQDAIPAILELNGILSFKVVK